MGKLKFLSFLLITLISGCMEKDRAFHGMLDTLLDGSVTFISAEELDTLNRSYILLDTRTEKEYNVSHIPNAKFIPFDEFSESMVGGIPRDTTVVIYCAVGYRSEKIGERLKDLGFKDVYNLYGGIFEWKNQGFEVVDMKGNTTDSVHTYNENWSQWLWNGTKVYE